MHLCNLFFSLLFSEDYEDMNRRELLKTIGLLDRVRFITVMLLIKFP